MPSKPHDRRTQQPRQYTAYPSTGSGGGRGTHASHLSTPPTPGHAPYLSVQNPIDTRTSQSRKPAQSHPAEARNGRGRRPEREGQRRRRGQTQDVPSSQGHRAQGLTSQGYPAEDHIAQGRNSQSHPAQARNARGRKSQGRNAHERTTASRTDQGRNDHERTTANRTAQGQPVQNDTAQGYFAPSRNKKSAPSGKQLAAAVLLFVLLLGLWALVGRLKSSPTSLHSKEAASSPIGDLEAGGKAPDSPGEPQGEKAKNPASLEQNQEQNQEQNPEQNGAPASPEQSPEQNDKTPASAEQQAKAAAGSPDDQPAIAAEKADQNTFTIAAVGDVLIHDALLNAGEQEDGTYDFRPLFTYLGPIIDKADLAAFDMEGVFRGAPYSGYPSFSVPEELADNLKEVGFDLAATANNHAMDFDVDAMMRTAQVVKDAGLIPVGTRADFGQPTFFLKEIKGIKVGISAFTYESPRQGADYSLRSFNNVPISVQNSQLIDSFYVSMDWPDLWEEDAARLEDRVKEMKKAGAEVIIFFMHWGTEYAGGRDQAQGYYAQVLADSGVDLVLGSGPHVIQEIRAVPSETGDHTMLCYYSVGNCVSNQQYDTGDSEGRAQDGLTALVSFKRGADGEVYIDRAGYVAHTVYKEYPDHGDQPYTKAVAIPIEAGLKDPQAWQLSEQAIQELNEAQARVREIMGHNEPGDLPLKAYSAYFE